MDVNTIQFIHLSHFSTIYFVEFVLFSGVTSRGRISFALVVLEPITIVGVVMLTMLDGGWIHLEDASTNIESTFTLL